MAFILQLQTSVKGIPISFAKTPESLKPLEEFLDKALVWIDEIPPIAQPMRFGNKAFRTWYEKVKESLETELFDFILTTEELKGA